MTVKELIAHLSKMPADALVVGRGYEAGYDDVSVHVERIVDDQGPGEKHSWWNGRYEDARYHDGQPFDAVVIS